MEVLYVVVENSAMTAAVTHDDDNDGGCQSFVSELAMHLMEADKDLNSAAHTEVEKLITSKVLLGNTYAP